MIGRNWRCEDRRCTLYDTRRGTAALLPRVVGGVPRCQNHGGPLIDDGPRTATVQLKLLVDGALRARFTLEDGSTVKVGREPGDGGIALVGLIPEQRTAGLSRTHVELRVTGGIVHVRDRSTYGTHWRSTAGRSGPGPWHKLGAEERQYRGGDELQLAEAVVLARSGRRFPMELAQEWQRRRSSPPDAAGETRMY
ncbi:FHA domain-containing protein [Streptomyces sp. JH14]|uniref:hypothetical protein n=1 Tax=Streptomyces sp. JH14 TaxID=2793630 RepID=UPI0023F98110|nr:hypothetical protein [Streptomyces sp. JH14]MDF6042779.1 FHA domain-containing protein [Streptomyces sp. JH14]